jgi:hypothetical protein
MARLEDLNRGAAVRGILPDDAVTVVSVQWFGSESLELTYKETSGRVANELLDRDDEPRLQVCVAAEPVHRSALSQFAEISFSSKGKAENHLFQAKQAAQKAVQVFFETAYAWNCRQRAPQENLVSHIIRRMIGNAGSRIAQNGRCR